MKPSSFSWPLSVKRIANQMKVAEDVALLADVLQRQDAGGEQHAEAEERHGREIELRASPRAPRAGP